MGAGRALPPRIHLPSGLVVGLSDAAAREATRASASKRIAGPCARDLVILSAPGVLLDADGATLDPSLLALRDANVLRALLAWAGIVPEEPEPFTCGNCDVPFDLAPSAAMEIAPFVDGELDDSELDAPFDFEAAHPIPALRVAGRTARTLRLAPRTAGDASALWRLAPNTPLRMTPALVAAMGVTALGNERRGSAIADALAGASAEAWGAIVDLYNDAHYAPRLVAVVRCASCGARNDVEAPLARDLPREPPGSAGERDEVFPDLEAFESRVRAIADRVYRVRGVRNVALFIDAGVPACDDGGEPLLGCYTPGGSDPETGIAQPPEVRLFYRTFESEFRQDPTFEIDAEIRETVEHEIEHHLHHLSGSDPMDEEEHAEIDREHVRRIGQREAFRRAGQGFYRDLWGFLRATWPLWLVVLAASALAWCA